MFERQWISEGRDDIDKLPLEPETRSYARMTSKDVMSQTGGTATKWHKSMALRKAVTNQRGLTDFKNQDKGQETGGKKLKESRTPEEIVNDLLR